MQLLRHSLALLLIAPTLAVSQEIRTLDVQPTHAVESVVALESLAPAAPIEVPAPAPATAEADQNADRPTGTLGQVLHALGGAAVGAWAGYLASQVWVGSWDDQRAISREGWAAGGAAVGITLGLTIPTGRVGPRAARFPVRPDRQNARNVLTRNQIQESNAGSLFAIIRSLRPEWLRTRGTGSMRETPRGEASGTGEFEINVTPGIPTIKVYLDETYMGDVAALHHIDPALVGEVRFLDAAEATQRLGMGHIHGAIMVTIAPVP